MILKLRYKYKLYRRKFLYFTSALYPPTRVFKSINKSYNKMFLTRFNPSRA